MGCVNAKDSPYSIKKRVNKVVAKEMLTENLTKYKFVVLPNDPNIDTTVRIVIIFI
jgi:hypothetical protein